VRREKKLAREVRSTVLDRLEQALERIVEGGVASVFRLRVQPADIGRQLERTMLDGRMTSVGAILAPNHYELRLHPEDAASFTGWEDALCREMEIWLADLAYERGLATVGPFHVGVTRDGSVPRRSVLAVSRFVDAASLLRRPIERPVAALELVPVNGPGPSCVLCDRSVTVGRSESNDLVLDGTEVSRRHARIEVDLAGRGWLVIDLNSTNGTWVNGVRTDRASIGAGDTVAFAGERFLVQSHDRPGD
jgi:FhaA, N-terminal domain/FHA domain